MSLVSVSAADPRPTDAASTRRRRSRWRSEVSTGWWVGRTSLDQVAVESALSRRLRGSGDGVVAEPVQLGDVGHVHGRSLGRGEQSDAELGGKSGQLRVELAQPVLVGLVEGGAGADEVEMVPLEELGRLGIESQLVAVGVQLVDPGEERAIQGDRVGVSRQPGGVLGFDRLELGVGVGRGQAPEHPAYAVEDPAGALQRDDGVREGGRGVAVGDHLDLGQLLGHPGVQTGPEVLDGDVGERR